MKKKKVGRPKKSEQIKGSSQPPSVEQRPDPNVLHDQFLKQYGLKLNFNVIKGTVKTDYGYVNLTDPTLVVSASYVTGKQSSTQGTQS